MKVPCVRQELAQAAAPLRQRWEHVADDGREPVEPPPVRRPDPLMPAQQERRERLVEKRVRLDPWVALCELRDIPVERAAEAGVAEPADPARVARVVDEVDDRPQAP